MHYFYTSHKLNPSQKYSSCFNVSLKNLLIKMTIKTNLSGNISNRTRERFNEEIQQILFNQTWLQMLEKLKKYCSRKIVEYS